MNTTSQNCRGAARSVIVAPIPITADRQRKASASHHHDEILDCTIELLRANFRLTRVNKLLQEEKRAFAERCEQLEADAAQLALEKYWLTRQCGAFALQAKTDQLTGLLRMEEFDERVNWWLFGPKHEKEEKRSGAMVFIDLDDFGRINKLYGHDAGNHVIRQIGWHLRKRSSGCGDPKQNDGIAARFGGDEFGLFLCEVSADDAEHLMVEIHEEFVRHTFRFQRSNKCALIRIRSALRYFGRRDGVHVSFSWGVAEAKPGRSAQTLRTAADIDMRRRKRRRIVW